MKRSMFLSGAILGLLVLDNWIIAYAGTGSDDFKWNVNLTTGLITEASTDLKFKKVSGIGGKRDVIEYTTGLHISPNGKFLVHGGRIIPVEKGDVARFVDSPACRSTWSPDGKTIAYYAGGIWIVPVSQEDGRPSGPPRKIINGNHWYESRVQWSPDSERLLFHSEDRQLNIFSIKDNSTTEVVRDGKLEFAKGGWSPDGQYIACRHPNEGIWIVPVDGGEPRKLIQTKGRVHPFWSSDGHWIFFKNDGKLQFVRISDAVKFEVTLPKEVGAYISSSPDGKLLFYNPSYKWTDTLKIISVSGGQPIDPARGHGFSATGQQWSNDSRFILTWGKHDDKWVNWTVPITGEDPYPLELDVSVKGELAQNSLSPDTKKLLFSSKSPEGQMRYWIVPVSVMTGKASGHATEVIDKGKVQGNIGWSEDGSKLMFHFDKDLWLSRTDGSGTMQLTGASDRQVVRPQFSPDGSTISWISYSASTGISVLRVRRLSKDKSRDIVKSPKYIRFKWSPDSSRILYEFYSYEENAAQELFVVSISNGEPQKLIEVMPEEYHTSFDYQWSPSADRLAFLVGRKLLLYRFPGGACRQVGDLMDPDLGRCYCMAWSPDEQTIALTLEEKPGQSNRKEPGTRVFTVTVPDGRWAELDGEPGYKYVVNWSPDGRWISYDAEEYVKIRPEGILWELDIAAYLKQMNQKLPAP
jgi:Tol biopolymer transport system component